MPPEVALDRLAGYLDDLLAVSKYEEGEASNGLMVDSGQPIRRLAAAVNTSFESIRGAAAARANLLLVHHTTWASIDLHLKEEKETALRRDVRHPGPRRPCEQPFSAPLGLRRRRFKPRLEMQAHRVLLG